MSNMKNGFSTLNRWLGKKNKDKAAINGKLSKSSTNLTLSVSSTNINETSQLEYNRITPLPAATSNAPFEQTFRITVLLPKEQLYVSRLGARVPLSKLLELVCENKLLDAEKYEFRNPVDPSQVYSCDLTIGAVGLSEIRLCNKSESYDTFNADEVIKLHRTSIIRDSLSSSEFSSRNSKHTTKTASPYSSSNSLNSMDSTGMNYTRTPLSLPPALPATTPPPKMMPVTAPPRKKRTAPRPPSQTAIPEKSTLVIDNKASSETIAAAATITEPQANLPRKDYYVSTPNLATPTLLSSENSSIDCNGNGAQNNQNGYASATAAIDDVNQLYAQVEKKNARNLYRGSVQNLSTTSEQAQRMPEPSPRKRLIQIKKKSSAPAPPPRNSSMYVTEDSLSIASTTPSTPDTPTASFTAAISEFPVVPDAAADDEPRPQIRATPKPQERETVVAIKPQETATSVESMQPQMVSPESPTNVPKPVPRLTTTTNSSSTTLLNAATAESNTSTSTPTTTPTSALPYTNVSKVMLNRTPTPEPRSLSCEPPAELQNGGLIAELKLDTTVTSEEYEEEDDDNVSKQADSGIGEPVPSPIPPDSSLPPSEGSAAHECKSSFESSSDDDDMIKVYNFKLGKTSVKMDVPKMLEELAALEAAAAEQTDSGATTPALTAHSDMTPSITDASSWNFAIPISPPPNFADNSKTAEALLVLEQSGDAPITPKIKQRPVLNFEALTASPTAESNINSGNGSAKATQSDVVDHRHFEEERESVSEMLTSPQPPPAAHTRKHNATTTLPSPSTPMSDIVDELSTIIHEKRIDSLIKKVEEHSEIQAAKPNTLSNFSITTIGNNNNNHTQQPQQQTISRPVESLDSPKSLTPEFPCDEEKLYSKNGSAKHASNLREQQRKLVTRADSFHTTTATTKSGIQTPNAASTLAKVESPLNDGLNSRSSSYLSLTKIEQNGISLSRRRSSSELSIGESPSLQSLEVIKTILNSRKNSLVNSSDSGESTTEIVNHIEGGKRTPTEDTKITSVELKPKSSVLQAAQAVEERQLSKTAAQMTKEVAAEVKEIYNEEPATREVMPKEIPKVYRYSGPPSINFSTWSERPKAQVSIKNEGDYIFGGKTTGNQNVAVTKAAFELNANTTTAAPPPTRNYRVSMPANSVQPQLKFELNKAEALWAKAPNTTTANTPPAVAPKPTSASSPTKRMGIPEKEFRVPLTVKPLEDVTVESIVINSQPKAAAETKTCRTTVTLNRTTAPASLPPVVVVNEVIKRPLQTNVANTSTLPRVATNRFSMPAATRSGQATLLRSTSITQLEAAQQPKLAVGHVESPSAPFGQNTLRKTGFKEKILAKEEAASQPPKIANGAAASKSAENYAARNAALTQNGVNGHIKIATTTTTATTKAEPPNSPPNKTLQSAKLELKLQNSNTSSVYLQQSNAAFLKPPTPKATTAAASSPTPPPPPPAIFKNGVASKTKHAMSVNGGGGADPRDQLLAAIRNFKRDELNRT